MVLAVLVVILISAVVQGIPVNVEQQLALNQQFETEVDLTVIQTTVKAAAALFQQLEHDFCSFMNSTMTALISEGKLIPLQTGSDLTLAPGFVIFMSVSNTSVSFLDILPSQPREPDDYQLLQCLQLDTISYNCNTSSLTATSRPYGAETIIPGIMDFRNVKFILSTGIQQETLVEFSGDWTIGNFELNIIVDLSFEGNNNIMVSGDISGDSDLDFRQLVQEITQSDIQLPPIVSGTFQHVRVEADSSTGAVVLSTQFGTNSKTYLIIQAQRNESTTNGFQISGAIAVEISSIQFSDLIQQVFGEDISSIPYFGSLTLPDVAFTTAEDTINSDTVNRAFMECPLLSNGGEIQEGIVAYLQTGFTSSVLQLIRSKGTLQFKVVGEPQLSLNDFLLLLPGVNLQSIILPAGVSDILDLTITGFLIDVNLRVVSVEVTLPMMLSYFDDVLVITDTTAVVSVDFMDNTLAVAVNGELTIAGINLDITVSQDDMDQYVLQASTEQLHITNIIRHFGANTLPSALAPIASNIPFLNFAIENLQITFPLMFSPPQVHIAGHPVINGYNVGPTAFTIIHSMNQIHLVQGFKLESVNLADLLGRISPALSTLLHAIIFLDQDINTAILISPKSLPDAVLSVDEFSDFEIEGGISIKATIPIPSGCSLDPFCVVYRFLVGDGNAITLQGTIVNPSFYSLIASIDDIEIGSGLTITDAGVEVRVGTTNDIGITGSIALASPDLTFTCRMAVRQPTTQVELEMTMSGCWQNPFGLPNVAICNLLSSIVIQPGVTVPTGLALGGELRIGAEQCGRVITAQGYIGLDTVSPQENYYYANVQGEVTIPSLLEAFCVTGVDNFLPRPLASTGFPNGFMISFALIEKVLPHVPLTIHQGFLFNGTINILGLTVHAELRVGLPNGFSMSVELPQISIANGLLVMSASKSAQNKGPTVQAEIDLLPQTNVNMNVNGYLSVLGISVETNMSITSDSYSFFIEGRMLNLFQATLSVSAPYGPIMSAPFRLHGTFRSDLYSAIEDLVSNVFQTVSDEANRVVDGLQRELDNANQIFDEADRVLRLAQEEFDRAHGVFDRAVAEVERLRRQVDNICRIRNCGSVCVGCISGVRCCGEACAPWGGGCTCVCWAPRWKGCCTRITDPACKLANEGCNALKAPIKALLVVAREAVDESRVVLDIARAGLQLAREAAETAERGVELANAALEAAQDTYQIGLQVVQKIASLGLGANQLVSIKEISFDAALEEASTGRFQGTLNGCFAGNEVAIDVSVNLHDITQIAKSLADRVVSGVSNFF